MLGPPRHLLVVAIAGAFLVPVVQADHAVLGGTVSVCDGLVDPHQCRLGRYVSRSMQYNAYRGPVEPAAGGVYTFTADWVPLDPFYARMRLDAFAAVDEDNAEWDDVTGPPPLSIQLPAADVNEMSLWISLSPPPGQLVRTDIPDPPPPQDVHWTIVHG